MAHIRKRHALSQVKKLASFWPAVGVLGLRQVGKTTLLRDQLEISSAITFDDDSVRADAQASTKLFLERCPRPVVLDEVQKVPALFDALKSSIDRDKRPGQFYLTGSTEFSSRIGIRESLTGRIGTIHLLPLTLAEINQKNFKSLDVIHQEPLRFGLSEASQAIDRGGLPVPFFSRDESMRALYWKSWMESTIIRDLSKAYGRGYDPEIAFSILDQAKKYLFEGELLSLKHFKQPSKKLRKYLQAMEDVFLMRRIPSHSVGIGKDIWSFGDAGIASSVLGEKKGEGATLTLARHFVINEILAQIEYSGKTDRLHYFKSARGEPVDIVWNNVPIKIVHSVGPFGWHERALHGAMKKLNSERGLLVAPVEQIHIPKGKGICVVPWTFWS